MQHKFVKENTLWYIDLPSWQGNREDLLMVSGADTFCDILAKGSNELHVELSTTPLEGATKLTFETPAGGGAWYTTDTAPFRMWLCEVTSFVFGCLPPEIYVRTI